MKTKREKILRLLISISLLSVTSITVIAVDNNPGTGNGTAIGTGSNASQNTSVAIGAGAKAANQVGTMAVGNNASADGDSSIALGNGSKVASNGFSLTSSIAIGKNAYVLNGTGQQEYMLSFNPDNWTVGGGLFSKTYTPKDLAKIPGGIAIGTNSYARTASVEIGAHTYNGNLLGGTTVDATSNANIVGMTTIGTNSYNKAALGSILGAYSTSTGDFDGSGGFNSLIYGAQNLGSNIVGSLNSIQSKGFNGNSGIANSIVGVANKEIDSNGAIIMGAGNTISHSNADISIDIGAFASPAANADAMTDTLQNAIKASKSAGSTLAIGGGNMADYTLRSSIIGVNNTIKGVDGSLSTENYISGVSNTATNVNGTTVIGTKRNVTDTIDTIIIGSSSGTTTTASNAVAIGTDANVTVNTGVAIGSQSIANRDKNNTGGYDMLTGSDSYNAGSNTTWNSTAGAVSVGDVNNGITRQITSVAAGKEDTDAVNVAQLKRAVAGSQITITAGTGISLDGSQGNNYVINAIGGGVTQPINYAGDTGNVTINPGSTLNVKGGATDLTDNNIGVVANGDTLNVKLAKDVQGLNSVTTKEITAYKGNIANLTTSTITAGDTTINNSGVTISNGPSMTKEGIDASNTIIKNVGDGSVAPGSMDAVNGGQLFNVSNKVDNLGKEVRKVGAGAAALAGLHPMDFDPDNKFNVAVSGGFYKNQQALALGAFFHPNEETMFSVASTVGNSDNMVNVSASFKVGQNNGDRKLKEQYKTAPISTVYALESEVTSQKQQLNEQAKEIQDLKAMVKQLMANK